LNKERKKNNNGGKMSQRETMREEKQKVGERWISMGWLCKFRESTQMNQAVPTDSVAWLLSAMCMKLGGSNGYAKY